MANAVIDGTDAVMLSQEARPAAGGRKAGEAMARICVGAEKQFVADTDFDRGAAQAAERRPGDRDGDHVSDIWRAAVV